MTMTLFDQFMSPVLMGVPLIVISLLFPCILFPQMTPQRLTSAILNLQSWFINRATHQILLPLNPAGHKWALLLMSLMLYLITLNMLGLLPYTFTPTTQLSMNMALAVPLWLATVILGMRNYTTRSLAHLVPEGSPTPLIPVLIVIETISLFIRPIALGVRLTANLTAGHLLIQLIGTAVFVLMSSMPAMALLTMILFVLMTLLEIAVAMIQAYVFILLLSLYLQENV
uniref:ATP synthase F0 subunit 6 n=1 Tax=Omobranchus fasciolatoceps TaxID=57835 RepID=UPI001EDFE01D|nr:ATP synthase F0 subunit 6 [Omobranchus fasciolatoceps]UHY39618.1 ATP synthase F0 subunit 6 [Omobranchus fasciolatoceps]